MTRARLPHFQFGDYPLNVGFERFILRDSFFFFFLGLLYTNLSDIWIAKFYRGVSAGLFRHYHRHQLMLRHLGVAALLSDIPSE
jgi:hypothetical protein